MGPSAIRIAGLADRLAELGHKVVDEGDVAIKNMEALKVGDVRARYLAEIARASRLVCTKVERIVGKGHFPLVLGGDHSISVGTVSAIAGGVPARGEEGRPPLGGRARRHQHAGDLALGQHPRHAGRRAARRGSAGADLDRRRRPQGGPAQRRDGRDPEPRRRREGPAQAVRRARCTPCPRWTGTGSSRS